MWREKASRMDDRMAKSTATPHLVLLLPLTIVECTVGPGAPRAIARQRRCRQRSCAYRLCMQRSCTILRLRTRRLGHPTRCQMIEYREYSDLGHKRFRSLARLDLHDSCSGISRFLAELRLRQYSAFNETMELTMTAKCLATAGLISVALASCFPGLSIAATPAGGDGNPVVGAT